ARGDAGGGDGAVERARRGGAVSDGRKPTTHDGFDEDETRLLRSFFRDEAHDYIERLTAALLGARAATLSADDVDELMRTTHTLKGSAATVGLEDVASVSHELEECFARLKSEALAWSPATADQLVE